MKMDHQLGHKEHQKVSNLLPTIGLVSVLIIILGLVFMNSPKNSYKISVEEMETVVLERQYLLRPPKVIDILQNNDTMYRFIDLRSAPEYLEGHLKGAINIPKHKILLDEYKDILNQDDKINVLYYSDEQCIACSAWMLLRQLGYKNNMVLQSGYQFIKANLIDDFSPMKAGYSDERPLYNYNEAINSNSGVSNTNSSSKTNQMMPIVKKKNKKKEEGGC